MEQPRASTGITIAWEEAPRRVAALADSVAVAIDRSRPIVVGITGPVASGKSTLAAQLSGCIVPTDAYLPDYEVVPYAERDLPRHADLARLVKDLEALRSGARTEIPVWSFDTHRREGARPIEPAPLIVCEGIHALDERVVGVLDVKVFVESPRGVRLDRWEARERSGARGWSVEYAQQFFREVAEPTFHALTPHYRARADFIVVNPG
jgi:uridine kinase